MITSSLIVAIMGLLLPTSTMAKTDHTYIIGIGETVRLEISDAGRSILSWSTGKYAQWDVNPLYLEVVEYSWDHATVRGLQATPLTVVQLTVTHNHDGIYGDKYYDAFHVKVLANDPIGIELYPKNLDMTVNDYTYLTPTLTPPDATTDLSWNSSEPTVAYVSRYGRVMALSRGTAIITVTTSNGLSDWCKVTVRETSDIDFSRISNDEEMVEIYDFKGTRIYNGLYGNIPKLDKGLYVIKTDTNVYKVQVR